MVIKTVIAIALLLLITFLSYGQRTSKDSLAKKDSLTLQTKFLSIEDLNRYAVPVKDRISATQYEHYLSVLNEILKEAIDDYNKRNGILPKKQ